MSIPAELPTAEARPAAPPESGGAAGRVDTPVVSGLSVCFVVPRGYPILSGRSDQRHIGGSEVQQWRIARALVGRGARVSFVTWDYGQPEGVVHDGVRVFKMCRAKTGLPGLRFFHPRWSSLWRAMHRADADIYYQRAAGAETGQAYAYCRWHRRPFVFSAASTIDCDVALPYLKTRRDRVLYRYGLYRADRVIAQTTTQVRMLRDAFGIDAALIRSCADDPRSSGPELVDRPSSEPPRVLWIGRFAVEKRAELLIELAAERPDLHFDVVGDANTPNAYAQDLHSRAATLPNTQLHGSVPFARMAHFYEQADVLLCTSAWEGFPNTFLEAWSRGIPVVSTVDPDGLIAKNGLGQVAESVSEMGAAINTYTRSADERRACGARCRRQFLEHHTPEAAAAAYEFLFADLVTRRSR